MSRTFLAAATLLLGTILATQAEAGAPQLARLQNLGAPPIVQVTNVCGNNGCVRVQTQRIRHQKPGSVAAKRI